MDGFCGPIRWAPHAFAEPPSEPVEPATGETPAARPINNPPGMLTTPAETEPPAAPFPDDALERVQAVLKGRYRALATKKQQADHIAEDMKKGHI